MMEVQLIILRKSARYDAFDRGLLRRERGVEEMVSSGWIGRGVCGMLNIAENQRSFQLNRFISDVRAR